MKSILFTLFLLIVIVSGCSKNSNGNAAVKAEAFVPPVPPAAPPSAKFTVTYTINNNGVKEGDDVIFENQSVNAVSYLWDFGDGGFTSTEKNPVFKFGCGTLNVKLTVTGANGASAVFDKDLLIYCKGRTIGGKTDANGHIHTGNTGE